MKILYISFRLFSKRVLTFLVECAILYTQTRKGGKYIMKKNLEQKIIRERVVDTNRFRYAYLERADGYAIIKCKREYIGTMAAVNKDNWLVVKEVKV